MSSPRGDDGKWTDSEASSESTLLLLIVCFLAVANSSPLFGILFPNWGTGNQLQRTWGGPLKPLKGLHPAYQKIEYRAPYYDKHGYGRILYGYGGRNVYKYTEFTPIEGFYR
ncbi:unnamed protein product [Darwinula stevensoni]|uniref:Uncharacterized protein n=1 Tax=Darwinula stevensoni TaxID=69355 RepID=A0A7R9A2U6_9CRUS|nr:unnamed protein product [Darwinula stevensoni]CAG0880226.1 unnamed protein product [Darwinula stevensoni]